LTLVIKGARCGHEWAKKVLWAMLRTSMRSTFQTEICDSAGSLNVRPVDEQKKDRNVIKLGEGVTKVIVSACIGVGAATKIEEGGGATECRAEKGSQKTPETSDSIARKSI
jgi:hypothetical protein